MYKTLFFLLLSCLMVTALENEIEGRGKKKKIALFIYIADLVLKKFFILKLIYAFVFWVVLHKAGYFLTWFISYLKDHKPKHHEHYDHHEYYVPHQHYEYGPPGPYRKESHGIY